MEKSVKKESLNEENDLANEKLENKELNEEIKELTIKENLSKENENQENNLHIKTSSIIEEEEMKVDSLNSGCESKSTKISEFSFDFLSEQKQLPNSIQPEVLTELKRNHFAYIKNWEDKRVQTINYHKTLFENILKKLFGIFNGSIEKHTSLLKFITERIKQDQKYANSGFTHPLAQKTQNFPELGSIFHEIDQFHLSQNKKIQDFANYVEESINKNLILEFRNNLNKEMDDSKEFFERNRKNLSKLNLKVAEKYSDFSKNYSEMMKLYTQQKKWNKDLYLYERKYLNIVNEHYLFQKQMGLQCIKLWQKILELEKKRIRNCKEVFLKYFQEYKKIFSVDVENFETFFQNFDHNQKVFYYKNIFQKK